MRPLAIAVLLATVSIPTVAPAGSAEEINALMDRWHRAAATADEAVFFGSMTDDAVYLGTDPSERWTKPQFMVWSKEHFEGETAWSFRPHDRVIYLSGDGSVAWFEELLDTWMGTCRGSGVLLKLDGGWKIAHYDLSVTIPNDLIGEYIDLLGKNEAGGKQGTNSR
jgi:ketosteroid isomerase-like protein